MCGSLAMGSPCAPNGPWADDRSQPVHSAARALGEAADPIVAQEPLPTKYSEHTRTQGPDARRRLNWVAVDRTCVGSELPELVKVDVKWHGTSSARARTREVNFPRRAQPSLPLPRGVTLEPSLSPAQAKPARGCLTSASA